MLVLQLVPFAFSVCELAADDRLENRGIFVGVSLDSAADMLSEEIGGPSFLFSMTGCKPPTDGEPATMSSWCRRSDVSDCFCMELTVCKVVRDEPALPELLDVKDDCEEHFRLATC